ncbi:hypothetical protein A6456_29385 [Paraburkholderia tropica]|nr:hypothetical protein A6456_29385 [Paraburkholderia tropica]
MMEKAMKARHTLLATLLGLAVAASGVTVAQAAGGTGGNGGTGNGTTGASGEGGGGYPEQGASITSSTTQKSTHHTHSKSHAKKPMNDTTNTPGADASSDTKGE